MLRCLGMFWVRMSFSKKAEHQVPDSVLHVNAQGCRLGRLNKYHIDILVLFIQIFGITIRTKVLANHFLNENPSSLPLTSHIDVFLRVLLRKGL